MRYFCFLLFIVNSFTASSQEVSLFLGDKGGRAIAFASVVNLSSERFTLSNENGKFTIQVNKDDSIKISHVNYKDLYVNDLVNYKRNDTVFLIPVNHVLQEVVVKPNKSRTIELGNITNKRAQYGLMVNTAYAFEIEIPEGIQGYLSRIRIPIKMRRKESNEGFMVIQLYADFNNESGFAKPIGLLNYVRIEELYGKKIIEIDIGVDVSLDSQSVFLYVNRVVSDDVFDNRDQNLSANPFFYYENKNSELNSYMKYVLFDDWYNLNNWFENSPAIDVRLDFEIQEAD